MRYIKIAEETFCKEDDIILILHARRAAGKKLIAAKIETRDGKFLDICAGSKRQSLIIMRDGTYVVTNFGFNLIVNRANSDVD